MSEASAGNTVKIHYTGRFEDGTVFDTSADRDPLEFTLGSGQVIPGMDKAVEGMKVGDNQTVSIPPEAGYGSYDERLVQSVPKTMLSENMTLEIGMQLQTQTPDGQVMQLVVTEIADETITVDANHPLAGRVLEFDIELVAVA